MRKIFLLFLVVFAFEIKAQSVVQSWVQTFHGPAAGDDTATAIAVDTNGNVFVTGASLTTNGYPDYNFATIKYSTAGLPLWTNFYDGTGNSYDSPVAIKLDSKGNVFVTGASYGLYGPDFATLAYSNDGSPLWTNRYSGPGLSMNQALGLAIDNQDDVCVIGSSDSAGYAITKYSNAGLPLWTNSFTGAATAYGRSAITTDTNCNILVTGASLGTNGYNHYETAKFSAAGALMWTNIFVGPGNYEDDPTAIAVDRNGNAFVTGKSWGVGTGFDFATVAYSSAGVPLWTNRFNGAGNDWDGATGIAVDTNGNVFVTGYSPVNGGGSPHYATLGYSGSGMPLWTNTYTAIGNDDEPSAIIVDTKGNVCVTGYSVGIGTSSDYATICYSTTGLPLWTNRYNGLQSNPDEAKAIAADAAGNIFVAGLSDSGFATVKYSLLQPTFLNMAKQNQQVVLTWTNTAFLLQSSPTVTGNFTNIADATSPYTNFINSSQQFFRLQAN